MVHPGSYCHHARSDAKKVMGEYCVSVLETKGAVETIGTCDLSRVKGPITTMAIPLRSL